MVKIAEIEEAAIRGVRFITPFSMSDSRGSILKCYTRDDFSALGIEFEIFEEIYINSKKGVLRGLHFQRVHPQSKMLSCLKGKVWCAVVDIDKTSKTFGKWVSFELSEKCNEIVYISNYCAIGTFALEDSIIDCKFGSKTYLELSDGIRWDDPDIGIDWPLEAIDCPLIVSDKDKHLKSFREY